MIAKYDGFDAVKEPGDYEKLEVGGYICKILKVTVDNKQYGECLTIAFDIAEGERKGYYRRRFDAAKLANPQGAKWTGYYYQTINRDSEKIKYFKGFIGAVEKSNPGYKWDWNEKSLEGKLFGGVFGEEEYEAKDGTVKTSVKCRFVRSVDHVRNGVDIPECKKLTTVAVPSYGGAELKPMDDSDELPF
jgi:hypothetical protein